MIPGSGAVLSDDDLTGTYSRSRRRRKTTRFHESVDSVNIDRVDALQSAESSVDSRIQSAIKKTTSVTSSRSDVGAVWRREEGSEGGVSMESKDSGRSTDSCSSGRSSPKHTRDTRDKRYRPQETDGVILNN